MTTSNMRKVLQQRLRWSLGALGKGSQAWGWRRGSQRLQRQVVSILLGSPVTEGSVARKELL